MVNRKKNIELKAGDKVTFLVTKTGLENIGDDSNVMFDEISFAPNQITCPHLKTPGSQDICTLCLKSQLKSKL